jgi:hypothetical protein
VRIVLIMAIGSWLKRPSLHLRRKREEDRFGSSNKACLKFSCWLAFERSKSTGRNACATVENAHPENRRGHSIQSFISGYKIRTHQGVG